MKSLPLLIITLLAIEQSRSEETLTVEISTITEGTTEWDMTQARSAHVPGKNPLSITTMSKTARVGAHGFHDVFLSTSRDLGKTWSEPTVIPSLKRFRKTDGYEAVPGDLWPQWHPASGKILITGKIFQFEGGIRENNQREQIAWASLDPDTLTCGPLGILEMPEREEEEIISPNAGCHQWVTLPDGKLLLPVRYQKSKKRNYTSTVLLCSFDGKKLEILDRGSEHNIPTKRGLYEPSVTKFGNEFFLTLRADDGAWVTKSRDGLNFDLHRPWIFDDGEELGSYNTQQHFAELGGRLYLIYTRRGAGNDHIMRQRAPLFIGQIDTENLTVLRSTEQILVPENDATLGNSGVCQINPNEAWITVAEGRVAHSAKRPGDTNRVFLAKVRPIQR